MLPSLLSEQATDHWTTCRNAYRRIWVLWCSHSRCLSRFVEVPREVRSEDWRIFTSLAQTWYSVHAHPNKYEHKKCGSTLSIHFVSFPARAVFSPISSGGGFHTMFQDSCSNSYKHHVLYTTASLLKLVKNYRFIARYERTQNDSISWPHASFSKEQNECHRKTAQVHNNDAEIHQGSRE